MLIIDCHCHAGEGDGFTGPWDTSAPLKKFMKWSEEAGIRKTVLFSAFHTDNFRANAVVGRIVKNNPDRFYGFAFVHAERDKGRINELLKVAVEQYGFRGIKVHRHDARISREICEVARKYRIPVLYDPTGEVSTVELIATEFPDVNFIIPHLSSFADDWRAQISFIDLLSRHKNVFTDTSGVRRFDLLEMAVKRAGAQKILFGTDGPWLHPKVELAKIYALGLSEGDLQLVLAKNLLNIFNSRQAGQP